jgi:hypothetical protein
MENMYGDISVRRKEDKVQLVREPNIPLTNLDAESAIKLSHEILFHADKILKADHKIKDG